MKSDVKLYDLNKLVSRKTAAKIYGCTAAAIDHHVRKGLLLPVFDDGHVKLYDSDAVIKLKNMGFHRGRPSFKSKKQKR